MEGLYVYTFVHLLCAFDLALLFLLDTSAKPIVGYHLLSLIIFGHLASSSVTAARVCSCCSAPEVQVCKDPVDIFIEIVRPSLFL